MFSFRINCVVILMLWFVSCRQVATNSQIKKIEIENLESTATIRLSDLGVEDISYIPLETNLGSLISKVYELHGVGGEYYIQSSKGILKFGSDGKFLFSIERQGKGPQEYLYCNSSSVNPGNKSIYILCSVQDKIVVYDSQGGYIKSMKCPRETMNINCFEDGVLCYCFNATGQADTAIAFVTSGGERISVFPNRYKFKIAPNNGAIFPNEIVSFKLNGQECFKQVYSDTIFSITDLQYVPSIILDRGGKTVPVSAKEQMADIGEAFKIKDKYLFDDHLLAFGNYLYLIFEQKRRGYILIVNLKDDTQYLTKIEDGVVNDIDGGLCFRLGSVVDNNTLINCINAFQLKAYVASEAFKNSTPKYPEKKKALEQLANSLNENDNPVLMLVKLKE